MLRCLPRKKPLEDFSWDFDGVSGRDGGCGAPPPAAAVDGSATRWIVIERLNWYNGTAVKDLIPVIYSIMKGTFIGNLQLLINGEGATKDRLVCDRSDLIGFY